MKLSSILPFIATALPILLMQHATPANAAALCIPSIYCPQASPSPAPACTEGGDTPPHASSTSTSLHTSTYVPKPSTTSDIKPTTTWTPPTTTSVVEPPITTTPVIPVSIPASAKSTYTPTAVPVGTSSAGEHHTITTTVTVSGAPQPTTGSSCSTGPVQCCNSVQSASSEDASNMLGLLGVVLQDVNVPVGLNCIPISVIGAGSGGTCNAQTVCCENNQFQGLINIGCTPINIGL
ncbi:hydrophobin-domain-containing protein [Sanghuangporus baumii]|uniref:Hydrophobin n=1 Tax=Sanghuangporus baumii TaxID=108892 RepID=A0A9Q5HXC3_SANBA|nr:hydrophobin-domain-containing protein [Sanghuangporus baumii]